MTTKEDKTTILALKKIIKQIRDDNKREMEETLIKVEAKVQEQIERVADVIQKSINIDRDGNLIVGQKTLGLIVGKDGEQGTPGINGQDGLGFDDLSVQYDDERTLILKYVKGEYTKEFELKLPIPIYKGVYNINVDYQLHDQVTYDGAIWTAQKSTTSVPGKDDSWKLSVKSGKKK